MDDYEAKTVLFANTNTVQFAKEISGKEVNERQLVYEFSRQKCDKVNDVYLKCDDISTIDGFTISLEKKIIHVENNMESYLIYNKSNTTLIKLNLESFFSHYYLCAVPYKQLPPCIIINFKEKINKDVKVYFDVVFFRVELRRSISRKDLDHRFDFSDYTVLDYNLNFTGVKDIDTIIFQDYMHVIERKNAIDRFEVICDNPDVYFIQIHIHEDFVYNLDRDKSDIAKSRNSGFFNPNSFLFDLPIRKRDLQGLSVRALDKKMKPLFCKLFIKWYSSGFLHINGGLSTFDINNPCCPNF
jgi:hypothetical protein